MAELILAEGLAPDTPGTNRVSLYAKTDGRLYSKDDAGTEYLLSNPTSNSYTPTLTNVANIAASTAYLCYYTRIGNVVTVSGRVDIDPTVATISTQLGISLPIPTSFSGEDLFGIATSPSVQGYSAAIFADATNDRAQLQFVVGTDVANRGWYFTFTYIIL